MGVSIIKGFMGDKSLGCLPLPGLIQLFSQGSLDKKEWLWMKEAGRELGHNFHAISVDEDKEWKWAGVKNMKGFRFSLQRLK